MFNHQQIIFKLLNILHIKIQDTTEFNLFWLFFKTSSWFYAPKHMRVIEVYSAVELKKMIEFTGGSEILKKDKTKFHNLIKNVYAENYSYTVAQRAIDAGCSKGPNPHKYTPIVSGTLLDELDDKFSVIYKKINFIQHNSFIPSAQTAYIADEICELALELNQIIFHNIISIYVFTEKEIQDITLLFDEMLKNLK